MASKNVLLLITAFLFATAGLSYSEKEFEEKVISKVSAPAAAPIEAPIPAPPLEVPTPAPSPTWAKQNDPTPPLAKPPVASPPPASPTMPPIRIIAECTPLCAGRCKLHSRPKACNKACKACCYRCKCVPPGTDGNREKCGKCYTNMTTRYKKSKCP